MHGHCHFPLTRGYIYKTVDIKPDTEDRRRLTGQQGLPVLWANPVFSGYATRQTPQTTLLFFLDFPPIYCALSAAQIGHWQRELASLFEELAD
ncbi:hypothetical protein BaRGS_00022242 [Batillaria attramentaria]|uniref:Uncharacterized protein n=1 Tax=Batillaria attramentaria TaxID=370345 RepID=A0ABD0KI09_9CAEN